MTTETSYYFKTELLNGFYTIAKAVELDPNGSRARIEAIKDSHRNKRMVKDGFTPGYQESTQRYAGGRLEYNAHLREAGLVEMGKDCKIVSGIKEFNPFDNDEMIKEIVEAGADLSGSQIDALKSGELMKDTPLITS